jgi:hypothetical protein
VSGPCSFVDLEHGIGDSYLMQKFDVTIAPADLRSIALGDDVYAALDASASGLALPAADPWQS